MLIFGRFMNTFRQSSAVAFVAIITELCQNSVSLGTSYLLNQNVDARSTFGNTFSASNRTHNKRYQLGSEDGLLQECPLTAQQI